MKGIAILGIILHNYCHWLKDIVRENEFTWQQLRCDRLLEVLQQPDELLPMHLFRPLWCDRVPFPQRLRTGDEV